jgi:hypothetical protein
MRQPMSMDFGGENSGGALQFIESEFARREGRPDPRTAMGAPGQIYNPFVQRPPEAPQMAVGGGSVQGVSQGDTMASGPAQAPAQAQATRPGMIPERDLVAVLTSGLTTEAQKKFAMDTLTQQRAMQRAEAERARADQQSRQAYEAANMNPALRGDPNIAKQSVEANFREKPEQFRNLTPAERIERGIDPNDRTPYQISTKSGKVVGPGGTQFIMPGEKADKEFATKFADGDAKTLGEVSNAGMAARRNMGRIDRLEALINENPTGGLAALQQRAGEFGINTKGLSGIQAAQALINSLVPEQRQPGSGPMSDADLALFKESLPRIINQPDGNKRIINTMRGIANYDAEGAVIVQQLRENKINRAQAFEALQNRVNPLAEFSQPPARTGAPAQPGQPTPAEIEAEMKRRGLR